MSQNPNIVTPPEGIEGEGFFATNLAQAVGLARKNSIWLGDSADHPLPQQALHECAGFAEVDLASVLFLHRGHDLAHVFDADGTDFLD